MKLFRTLLALMLAFVLVSSLIACDVADLEKETQDSTQTDPTGTETVKPTDDTNGNNDENDENDGNGDASAPDASWKDKTVEEILAMNVANFKKLTSYLVDIKVNNISDGETHASTNKMLVTGIDAADLSNMNNLKAEVSTSWGNGTTSVIFDGTTMYSKSYNDYSDTYEKIKMPMTPAEFYEQALKYMAGDEPEEPAIPNMPLLCVEELPAAFAKAEKIVGEDGKIVLSFTEIKEDQDIIEAYVENVKQELDFERAFAKLYLDDNGNIVKVEMSAKYSFDPNKGNENEGTTLTVSDTVETIDITIDPEDTVSAPADASEYLSPDQIPAPNPPQNGGGSSESYAPEGDGAGTGNDIGMNDQHPLE